MAKPPLSLEDAWAVLDKVPNAAERLTPVIEAIRGALNEGLADAGYEFIRATLEVGNPDLRDDQHNLLLDAIFTIARSQNN